MRMINSYLIFTFEKEPTEAQIRLRFHSQGGMKCKEVGSLKEAFNIYIPPNNPPENMARRQKGVNSMHHRMRCYHVTRKSAMFVFRKRLKSLCVI